MRGVTAVALGALLVVLFLAILAVLAWQASLRRRETREPVYGTEEATEFVHRYLGGDAPARSDVRRILEWEIHYLQARARAGNRRGGFDIVAGGTDEAVAYIVDRARTVQKREYDEQQVRAVLRGEAAYLESIGAIGPPVRDPAEEVD